MDEAAEQRASGEWTNTARKEADVIIVGEVRSAPWLQPLLPQRGRAPALSMKCQLLLHTSMRPGKGALASLRLQDPEWPCCCALSRFQLTGMLASGSC